jgi:RNA polymerase sigma-B factor
VEPHAAARAALIEEYLPLAERLSRRFAYAREGRDDLAQVAALAVVRAVDRRDPDRAESLPAYVARCVEGELRRHLRDRVGVVRVPRRVAATARPAISLEDVEEPVDASTLDDIGLDRALVARAARALDQRERRVVLLHFFADRTQSEIGDELGLSQAHVSRMLTHALAKMRRRLAVAAL